MNSMIRMRLRIRPLKNVFILAALMVWIFPAVSLASYTENSPEFKEVAGQLSMDGHSEHDITTCKVRKAFNAEILEMLDKGMKPDEIVGYYTNELGPGALKVPDKGVTGLVAWLMPAIGLGAGGLIAGAAIKKITKVRKNRNPMPEKSGLSSGEFASLMESLDTERKKHF